MKNFIAAITIPVIMMMCVTGTAQSFHVRSINTEDGLSHGYVSSLHQDSRGYIWIGTIYGLNRYDGYQCKSYVPNQLDKWSLHASIITAITEDQNGLLWLGTDNGVVVFNPFSEKFIHLDKLDGMAPTGIIRDIMVDEDNNIWCLQLSERRYSLYNIRNCARMSDFLCLANPEKPSVSSGNIPLPQDFGDQVRVFYQTSPGTCMLANDKGMFFKLDTRQIQFTRVSPELPLILNYTSSGSLIFTDHDFASVPGADERYGLLSAPDGSEYFCQFFDKNIYKLNTGQYPAKSSDISSLPVIAQLDQPQSPARLTDRSGKIWVGTIGDGVRIIEPVLSAFKHLFDDINLCNPGLMPEDKIWAGMYAPDKVLDPVSGQISSPLWSHTLSSGQSVNAAFYNREGKQIYLVIAEDQKLNFDVYDMARRQRRRLLPLDYPTQDPVIMKKDSRGNIWLASVAGEVVRYQPGSGQMDHWNCAHLFPEKTNHGKQMARCVAEDKSGRIWISSDAGLLMINTQNGQPEFKAFHNNGENGPVFKSSWIFSVYPDPSNADLLWLGTLSGGLAKFDVKTGRATYVLSGSNQRFDVVTGILPDTDGNMWLATNKGIFKYLPSTNVFIDYSRLKHIPRIDINAAAAIISGRGEIIVGGTNGLVMVKPSEIPAQRLIGQLLITHAEINRQSTYEGIIAGKILISDKNEFSLNLAHDDNFVSLGFSIPAAADPEALLYRYKIEGLNEKWIYNGQNHTLELTGLSPGSYTIEVQAIGGGESWSEATTIRLPVRVSPPWYASKLAYLCYFAILAIIVRAAFRYQQKRLALQFTADLNQKEMERLQSMDDFKNRFFAYIAHEFKTPLTIIMGASEQLRRLIKDEKSVQYPEAIVREGNSMLNLINELIDVTRLQDKSIKPHYDHREIVAFLKNVVASHQPLTDLNQIRLEFDCDHKELYMDMDPLRTQYILNNLLSNAIQHTSKNGLITVKLEKSGKTHILISVSDTGTGIAREDLPHIFEKYYRAPGSSNEQNNFGLGLSFVKELTELLHGSVSAESNPGEGTTFSLILPVSAPDGILVSASNDGSAIKTNSSSLAPGVKLPQDAPHVLIVDDNPAILSYLKSVLQPHFKLSIANNGREGLELAIQEIPNLVLTDVMMPVMDGIEMTAMLKTHQLTSHIPVVMLSAKNEVSDRIKGQEEGADIYLGKPFNDQELVLTLQNLFKLQQQWKKRYATVSAGESSLNELGDMPEGFNKTSISNNDAFMQRLLELFEDNYANEKFDAPEIAAAMNISKAQLYRKISQISEESVMGLLRNYRLKKAVELLEKFPDLSTKEIAYKVGYKEYSHFSASFKKQFQVAPSEWKKNGNQKTTGK